MGGEEHEGSKGQVDVAVKNYNEVIRAGYVARGLRKSSYCEGHWKDGSVVAGPLRSVTFAPVFASL